MIEALPKEYDWLLRMPLPKTVNEGLTLLGVDLSPTDWLKKVCERAGKIVIDRAPVEMAGNVLVVVDVDTVEDAGGRRLVQMRPPHNPAARRLKRGQRFDPLKVGAETMTPVLGDIVVSSRRIGLYLGQDEAHFHILTHSGVARVAMEGCVARRPPYTLDDQGKPVMLFTAKAYHLSTSGRLATA